MQKINLEKRILKINETVENVTDLQTFCFSTVSVAFSVYCSRVENVVNRVAKNATLLIVFLLFCFLFKVN